MTDGKYDPFAVPEGYNPNDTVTVPEPQPSLGAKLASSSWANALMFLLALGFAMGVIYLPRYLSPPQADQFTTVGFPFPVFQIEALSDNAKQKDLTSFQLIDKVTLVTIWAPWSPQSEKELASLAPIIKRYSSDTRFQWLSVAYPDNQIVGPISEYTEEGKSLLQINAMSATDKQVLREKADSLLKSLDIPHDNIYWDPYGSLANAFYMSQPAGKQQFSIPLTLLIDAQKTIRAVWLGYEPGVEKQIASHLSDCLSKSTSNPPAASFAPPSSPAGTFRPGSATSGNQ